MRATFLKEIPTSRDMLSTFGGYDGRERIAEGSFGDMLNLSSRHYPVMSTRRERAWLKDIEGLQGILIKDKIAWVADNKFYYNGQFISDLEPSGAERKLVSMGVYVVIYPDQVRYNPATGAIEKLFYGIENYSYALNGGWPYSYSDYNYNSGTYSKWSYTRTDVNGDGNWDYYFWYDYSVGGQPVYPEGDILVLDIVAGNNWDYEFISYDGGEDKRLTETAAIQFKELASWTGELEFVRGIDEYYRCKPISITTSINTSANSVYADATITIKIKIDSITQQEFYEKKYEAEHNKTYDDMGVELKWRMIWPPRKQLDGVFESGNRLWGYRYGENALGDFVNEVYSTALGDPTGWDTFESIASDSYAATIGSDGPFTGAIEYSGSLYFFKENYMHRLMGSKPSSYQISTLSCHGVEAGSERSLVCLGDALYYKGNDGIYCYDGSIPYRISEVFGEKRYKNAVGGVLGSMLFMDMENEQGKRVMFVYDTSKRLWHIEESAAPNEFIPAFGNLIYRTERGLGAILGDELDAELTELFGDEIKREGFFKWFGEFGDFGLSSPDAKYVSKLQLRMTVDEGAKVCVEVMTDSDGSWETAAVISAQNKRSVCLPIVTPRCDHFRIKLSGEGGFKLWSMTKEIESTNEVR